MTSSVSRDEGSDPLRRVKVTVLPTLGAHWTLKATPEVRTELAIGWVMGLAVSVVTRAAAVDAHATKAAKVAAIEKRIIIEIGGSGGGGSTGGN